MSFLKSIWKNGSKHKKLSEEWALAKNKDIENELTESTDDINESENEDVTFNLKYIGSTLVDRATNESVTADAIKTILRVAKAAGKKLPRVTVTVSLKGIKISDGQSGKDNDISIYRISYCSADAAHNRVFAFIAANHNETMECHAFLCAKRKQAQAVTLALARSFSMAYEAWRLHPSSADKEKMSSLMQNPHGFMEKSHNIMESSHIMEDDHIMKDNHTMEENHKYPQLIDLDDFDEQPAENVGIMLPRPHGVHKNDWVSFDDENDAQQRWKTNQQRDLICS